MGRDVRKDLGAVAFDFVSPHDFVEAKKAWFFFDEEYVCLGTGIRSEQVLPVATTINQVLMRSEVTVSQSGTVPGVYDAGGDAFRMAPDRNNDRTTIVVTLPEGVYAGKSVSCGL